MKRWAIRLTAVTAIVGLGWFTVAWAQRQNADIETTEQGPDFSKPPVNFAAATATDGSGNNLRSAPNPSVVSPVAGNSSATNTPSVDPFQSAANLAGQRYREVEPQPLQPDPNAAALATDTSEIATKQASHSEGLQPQEPNSVMPSNAAGNNLSSGSSDQNKSVDPFSSSRGDRLHASDAGDAGKFQPSAPSDDRLRPDDSRYGQSAPANDSAAAIAGTSAAAVTAATDSTRYPESTGNAPPSFGGNEVAREDNYRRNPALGAAPHPNLRNETNDVPQGGNFSPPGLVGNATTHSESILPPRDGQTNVPAMSALSAIDRGSAGVMPTGGDPYNVAPATNLEGYGKPGDKKLEGAQSPSVTIQKIAPPEIQVGKPAKFEIIVRNTGSVVAENVEVTEAVPQGTMLVSTTPQTQRGQHGEILWKVGELKPAEETKLQIELMPVAEGEIGSVAVVQFRSSASMRTIATKPELTLELNAPKQVMIGGDVTVGIKISNPGTGAAEKIVLHEMVPPGFQHPAGGELEFDVGMLKPGESRELDLTLHAVQAGMFNNAISVTGDANLRAEQVAQIQVIAPALEVAINGPGLRYLERQAKYNVSVNNPGTASAKDVELITRLPKGMQFVEASDKGHYDANSHSVVWSLAELPPNQAGTVTLTTLAVEPGEQRLRGEGRAAGGLSNTTEETTIVEGVAAVLFTVVDVDDPVEVGGQATYEIKVVNQGSKAASRVTVVAVLPPELRPVSAEGPAQYKIDRDRLIFEPMTRLAPKADITYRIQAQAVSPGDSRIKVLLQTDEMTEPVTKEESTRVYKD